MIVNITNRNSKVSNDVKNRIEAWLYDSQDRYDIITSAQVTLDKTDRQDEAEATIHAAGKEVFAKASGSNLYAALDSLGDKIDRQLEKIRQKQMQKKGAYKLSNELIPEDDLVFEDEVEYEYQS